MAIKFSKEELKRVNRLLLQEIRETKAEMVFNHSKEIGEYLNKILKHRKKIELALKDYIYAIA